MLENINPTPQQPNEQEIERLEKLQKEILEKKSYIIGMCRKALSQRYTDQAEALGNQALEKALRKASQYRREATLNTWLGRIAINEVNAFYRRIKHEPSEHGISEEEFEFKKIKDTKPNAEEIMVEQEQKEIKSKVLKDAIEQLTPKQKRAVELSLNGNENKENAMRMGTTLSAFKSVLAISRKKLKEILGNKK